MLSAGDKPPPYDKKASPTPLNQNLKFPAIIPFKKIFTYNRAKKPIIVYIIKGEEEYDENYYGKRKGSAT